MTIFTPTPEPMLQVDAVIVVDPFSTGMCLAEQVMDRGYACIAVYSDTEEAMKDWMDTLSATFRRKFVGEVFNVGSDHSDEQLSKVLRAVVGFGHPIVGVIAGAEPGVPLTDRLSERLNLTTNGSAGSEGRRNKYIMGEKIRAAGMRAVLQCLAPTFADAKAYIENDLKPEPFRVIVKPVDSAGSDDVSLCTSLEDVQKAYDTVLGKVNHLGIQNQALLVQEYLEGTEYVIDTVSRDGEHKVVAVWEYDKRSANGAAFVYFGALLREAKGDVVVSIVDYVCKVLDVLSINHGPGHAEVKFVKGEPCLIEIGARCHGREGTDMPILDKCQGYNQVGATLDAYFDKAAFQALPKMPTSLRAHGIKTTLVSYEHGTLQAMPGLAEIEAMASYVDKKIRHTEGVVMAPTIDMFTTPGCVLMVHEDASVLQADYERIRELEVDGLYALVGKSPKATKKPAVKKAKKKASYSKAPATMEFTVPRRTAAQISVASS
ncbi:hypothetical protein SPRG_08601 [Saprolegnia parasitica CBS 223.65]|uniref:ATP-grasp domain-containing protein n=1 Tax=Saprolegnia parasitica (strain CBS 223.65) TaxID=695850 RepID=A0A067CGK0_SAPPC|nr:hypothetical protein SPRG_08601 [Saprolegnia parasitica CBS 223.65]KDO25947.1 hypothetical protein SPRG_08601 [Saprolegnia parasitica CBS 223.65]|eukprot:XP_012203235.1 hypothetical protein SPRG_08601 [Saprolegnia parasitica CBS 223.65]